MTTLTKKGENPDSYIDYLVASKMNFLVKYGKHSCNIINDNFKLSFISSMKSGKFFNAVKKIESDLSPLTVPSIDETLLEYFTHDIREDFFIPEVHCIDISAAYATSLRLKEIISPSTYNYILGLPKQERLSSVGMLAKESTHIFYKRGEAKKQEVITGPYRNFFFLAVEEVSSIMRAAKMEVLPDYMLTWVDCIYLTNGRYARNVMSLFDSLGYQSKYFKISNFKTTIYESRIKVEYIKNKMPTYFYIPLYFSYNSKKVNNERAIRNLSRQVASRASN